MATADALGRPDTAKAVAGRDPGFGGARGAGVW